MTWSNRISWVEIFIYRIVPHHCNRKYKNLKLYAFIVPEHCKPKKSSSQTMFYGICLTKSTQISNYCSVIEFKDFILGFRQSTFLCTTLKCIEKFRIPFIKSGIPASNLGSSEARNPAKFAACCYIRTQS